MTELTEEEQQIITDMLDKTIELEKQNAVLLDALKNAMSFCNDLSYNKEIDYQILGMVAEHIQKAIALVEGDTDEQTSRST